jgi:predicted nucleic acid-binding protein
MENVYRDPAVACVDEPPATRSLWLQLAGVPLASPNAWMDAYLAALAIMLGAEFVTFDRAFLTYAARGLTVRLLSRA